MCREVITSMVSGSSTSVVSGRRSEKNAPTKLSPARMRKGRHSEWLEEYTMYGMKNWNTITHTLATALPWARSCVGNTWRWGTFFEC